MIRRWMSKLGLSRSAGPAPASADPAAECQGMIPLDDEGSLHELHSIHGAHLLWVIRDNICGCGSPVNCPGTGLVDLCRWFRVSWNPFAADKTEHPRIPKTGEMNLFEMLRDLMAAGFLEFHCPDGRKLDQLPGDRRDLIEGGLVVTEKWVQAQEALGVSLAQMASALPGRGTVVQPMFGAPGGYGKKLDVYVIMPFAAAMRSIYTDHIRPVVERLGYSCLRGDDECTTHSVMSDIWRHITSARLIIAECTARNPNVFYEIGIAHTVGTPVIILAQDGAGVPFDVRHIRFIEYSPTPSGLATLQEKLAQTVRYEISRTTAPR